MLYGPPELMIAIVELLAERHLSKSLADLSTASRATHALVLPVLYREVFIPDNFCAVSFLQSLSAKSDQDTVVATLVRTLCWAPMDTWTVLRPVLELCRHLHTLKCHVDPSLTSTLAAYRLRRLFSQEADHSVYRALDGGLAELHIECDAADEIPSAACIARLRALSAFSIVFTHGGSRLGWTLACRRRVRRVARASFSRRGW